MCSTPGPRRSSSTRSPSPARRGSYFWDYDGKRYLDFSSGLVYTNIGYQHPKVVAAIQEQAARLTTFAPAFAIEARSEAARMIEARTPGHLDGMFFTNGGATPSTTRCAWPGCATGRAHGAAAVALVPRRHRAGREHHR
ncbi:Acetylornithine/succinyldiaminopimelate aminotransferase [Streptomyces alboniger]